MLYYLFVMFEIDYKEKVFHETSLTIMDPVKHFLLLCNVWEIDVLVRVPM
jgi:hypothetical protein